MEEKKTLLSIRDLKKVYTTREGELEALGSVSFDVGVEEFVQVDTGEFAIKDNDIFLLCSDGLTNMTSEEEIKQLLAADDGNKAAKLVQAALDGGGLDNVTAIVVEYHE